MVCAGLDTVLRCLLYRDDDMKCEKCVQHFGRQILDDECPWDT
jgi:hypothetical protein